MRISAAVIAVSIFAAPIAAAAQQSTTTVAPAAVAPGPGAFVGPSGWSHNPPAGTDPARTVEQWHIAGDIASLTFMNDTTQTYADALTKIHNNITSNNIKTSADRDVACKGTTGHVVEFAYGPDGHRVVINRIIVPDGSGIDTITYSRSSDESFDPEVKKSESTYCGSQL